MKVENVSIEAIKLENQGLKQTTGYWLKVSKNGKEFTMSVGEQTYKNVLSLEEAQQKPINGGKAQSQK